MQEGKKGLMLQASLSSKEVRLTVLHSTGCEMVCQGRYYCLSWPHMPVAATVGGSHQLSTKILFDSLSF